MKCFLLLTHLEKQLFDALVVLSPFVSLQNYFRDAWNIFDFVSVVGSITDILVTELWVSALLDKFQKQMQIAS